MLNVGESSRVDEDIAEIWRYLIARQWSASLSAHVISQLQIRARQLQVENNGLYHLIEGHKLWVVLGRDRQSLLDRYHTTLGHCEAKKLLQSISQTYWWPNMSADCHLWVKSYPVCQRFSRPAHHSQLRPFPSDSPLQLLAIDVLGPFPPNLVGNQYVLSVVDLPSRYLEMQVIPGANIQQVVKAFRNVWIKR